jgi:cell division protease FtsH
VSRQMITRFGMSDKLGPRIFGFDPQQPFLGREREAELSYSEEKAQEIDEEIYRLIEEAHQRAARVLREHERVLNAIAAILIEYKTIDKEQFERLLQSEPEQTLFAPHPRAEQAKTAEAARKRRMGPARARGAKPLPSSLVAHAVQPDDLKPQATNG